MLLIVWLVVGTFFGWLVGRIVEGYGIGLIGNMVVGVIGAAIADLLLQGAGIITVGGLGEVISSVIGAVILLLIVGLFKRRE
jgi:uncharacterized membrane protein YeaQ/YmgE (transglycosylase-associated protein family)